MLRCLPCLDEKGWLLDALAAIIKFAKEQSCKGQLVVFGHADRSSDHSINCVINFRGRSTSSCFPQASGHMARMLPERVRLFRRDGSVDPQDAR